MGLTAKAIQISVENALRDRQMSDIRRFLTELVEGQEQIDRIRVFNHALQPTLVSNPLSIGEQVPDDPLRRVLQSGVAEWFYVERGIQPVLYYIVPLRGRRGGVEAALEIVQLASGVEERVRAARWDVVFRLGTLLVSVALLTGFILQRQVLRPLARLMDGIRRLDQGVAAAPLPVERPDELGRVAAAFNTMAEHLDSARAKLLEETERALELERQVRHAQTVAVAGRLATALAHEVGTPLNIISGRAETVLRGLPADDRRRDELTVIIDQIDRICGMIRSLLDTVRPAKPEIQRVDIAPVVTGLAPLLRHAARVKAVALETDVPASLPTVLADPNQLQQIVINLVVNAVEATPDGGTVRIAATTAEHEGRPGVHVVVRDSGPGIPADLRARVFQPFFTTKPPGHGTGLGLTICRDIVKEHGGTIAVDDAPEGGAAVVIWLPVAESAT
jgi:signal transduction histidine kinase